MLCIIILTKVSDCSSVYVLFKITNVINFSYSKHKYNLKNVLRTINNKNKYIFRRATAETNYEKWINKANIRENIYLDINYSKKTSYKPLSKVKRQDSFYL